MTDLSRILPEFPVGQPQYARLLPAIERQQLTTTDLLTLDVADIGRRTQLPLLDIKRLCNAVLEALHVDLGVSDKQQQQQQQQQQQPERKDDGTNGGVGDGETKDPAAGARKSKGDNMKKNSTLKHTVPELAAMWRTISTLDEDLDRALGGGIPTGYITEITGESGAGKTQLLLTLLLACQLPPSLGGLGRPALYVSTEAPLSTVRLSQVLRNHPRLRDLSPSEKPTLDGIVSAATPDLESQDHILSFQVPVEVARRGVGLVVLDSVAANYRAEFERRVPGGGGGPGGLAARSNELVRLGRLLHDLATQHDLAVVVSNQVADRFPSLSASSLPMPTPAPPRSNLPYGMRQQPQATQESPLASRSRGRIVPNLDVEPTSSMPLSAASGSEEEAAAVAVRSSMPEPPPPEDLRPGGHQHSHPALLLDHQQRWFTGWGDDPAYGDGRGPALKTPSLGLVWSTQIAARVALLRRPAYGRGSRAVASPATSGDAEREDSGGEAGEGGGAMLRSWRRWMKVVFAPHVAPSGRGLDGAVEFEVTMGGLRAVERKGKGKSKGKANATSAAA
ncbi:hypothetical protein DL769_008759 [Monosporascus sp. CRB-8-3]|nr:hypothetical protein DL769_008759 [Monosporascus sp. CRB-8-3]